MLGRLASIIAKQLLSGQHVVSILTAKGVNDTLEGREWIWCSDAELIAPLSLKLNADGVHYSIWRLIKNRSAAGGAF